MTSPSYMPGAGSRPARRFGVGAIISVLAVGLLLGGGGGYLAGTAMSGDDTAALVATDTTSQPDAPATSAASQAAPPADDRRFALGKVWTFDNGAASTVVLRYRAAVEQGENGTVYNAVEVRTCIGKTADTASMINVSPWSLEDADGGNYQTHVSGAMTGEYPYSGKTVEPGRCVKGWLVFEMPKDVKPTLAVYEGAGNQGRPAEWKIG